MRFSVSSLTHWCVLSCFFWSVLQRVLYTDFREQRWDGGHTTHWELPWYGERQAWTWVICMERQASSKWANLMTLDCFVNMIVCLWKCCIILIIDFMFNSDGSWVVKLWFLLEGICSVVIYFVPHNLTFHK